MIERVIRRVSSRGPTYGDARWHLNAVRRNSCCIRDDDSLKIALEFRAMQDDCVDIRRKSISFYLPLITQLAKNFGLTEAQG